MRYSEEKELGKVRLHKPLVLEFAADLHRLVEIQRNLSFPKLVLGEAVQLVWDFFWQDWGMQRSHQEAWEAVIALRLRNLFKSASTSGKKGSQWMQQLPWISGDEVDDVPASQPRPKDEEDESENAKGPTTEDLEEGEHDISEEYEAGWSLDVGRPWRKLPNKPMELGQDIQRDEVEKLNDEDPIVGYFDDGVKLVITEMTKSRWMGLYAHSRKPGTEARLWEKESIAKHRIHIAQRCDRHLLISLFEQGRQVLQCKVSEFGNIADNKILPPENPILARALDFMKDIGEKYAAGEIEPSLLK